MAVPEGGDIPGVLAIHSEWGLTSFFKSFCDKLADAGFVVLAPDLYDGKTAPTAREALRMSSRLRRMSVAKQLKAAVNHLLMLFAVTGQKVGIVGFSMGASWGIWLATKMPKEVGALAAFYGTRRGDFRKARSAFLGHFAEDDAWVKLDSVRRLEKEIRAARRPVRFHMYPGTKHWFFEKERPSFHNAEAAELAWKRTIRFLRAELE